MRFSPARFVLTLLGLQVPCLPAVVLPASRVLSPRPHGGGPTWFDSPHTHWRRGLLPRRARRSLCRCRRCAPF